MIESISAITLATHGMEASVRFYAALGFDLLRGGADAAFTTFHAGSGYVNLIAQPESREWTWWGRVIFHVSDVDAVHARAVAHGYQPEAAPRDAVWGRALLPHHRPRWPRTEFRPASVGVGARLRGLRPAAGGAHSRPTREERRAMQIGIHLPHAGEQSTPALIRRFARQAEDLGFSDVWVSEHIIVPRDKFPRSPLFYDPVLTLTWIAAVTERVRLGTSVLVLPMRHPLPLAKELATLHNLSDGRLILGAGVGWLAPEFAALGVPFNGARPPSRRGTDDDARGVDRRPRHLPWPHHPGGGRGDDDDADASQPDPALAGRQFGGGVAPDDPGGRRVARFRPHAGDGGADRAAACAANGRVRTSRCRSAITGTARMSACSARRSMRSPPSACSMSWSGRWTGTSTIGTA